MVETDQKIAPEMVHKAELQRDGSLEVHLKSIV